MMAPLVCNRFKETLYDPELIFKSKMECFTPLLGYLYSLLSAARVF